MSCTDVVFKTINKCKTRITVRSFGIPHSRIASTVTLKVVKGELPDHQPLSFLLTSNGIRDASTENLTPEIAQVLTLNRPSKEIKLNRQNQN